MVKGLRTFNLSAITIFYCICQIARSIARDIRRIGKIDCIVDSMGKVSLLSTERQLTCNKIQDQPPDPVPEDRNRGSQLFKNVHIGVYRAQDTRVQHRTLENYSTDRFAYLELPP